MPSVLVQVQPCAPNWIIMMLVKSLNTNPKLLELLEKVKSHVMTKEEKDAQRKSWVIGNFMLDHPDVPREYTEEIYKKVTGE